MRNQDTLCVAESNSVIQGVVSIQGGHEYLKIVTCEVSWISAKFERQSTQGSIARLLWKFESNPTKHGQVMVIWNSEYFICKTARVESWRSSPRKSKFGFLKVWPENQLGTQFALQSTILNLFQPNLGQRCLAGSWIEWRHPGGSLPSRGDTNAQKLYLLNYKSYWKSVNGDRF